MKTKILIVDDYNIFRKGLKLILEKCNTLKVVGEALNSDELFKLLETIKPDLIVMNLMLPHHAVVEISKKLSKDYPTIPFILITARKIESTLLGCIMNGARGVVWKDSSPTELIRAIKTVASGENYFIIPESRMLNHAAQHSTLKNDTRISFREQQVLKLIANGYSYKEIGSKLNISPRTVESHKNNILVKLDLHSVTDLIKYAIRSNLIDLN